MNFFIESCQTNLNQFFLLILNLVSKNSYDHPEPFFFLDFCPSKKIFQPEIPSECLETCILQLKSIPLKFLFDYPKFQFLDGLHSSYTVKKLLRCQYEQSKVISMSFEGVVLNIDVREQQSSIKYTVHRTLEYVQYKTLNRTHINCLNPSNIQKTFSIFSKMEQNFVGKYSYNCVSVSWVQISEPSDFSLV